MKGSKSTAKSPAPAAAPQPMMPAGDINHAAPVYHYGQLHQNANVPLPGTYVPAHPSQNGKG